MSKKMSFTTSVYLFNQSGKLLGGAINEELTLETYYLSPADFPVYAVDTSFVVDRTPIANKLIQLKAELNQEKRLGRKLSLQGMIKTYEELLDRPIGYRKISKIHKITENKVETVSFDDLPKDAKDWLRFQQIKFK